MDLSLVISAGWDTPEKLADFCCLPNDEQDRLYAEIAANAGKGFMVCDISKKEKGKQ